MPTLNEDTGWADTLRGVVALVATIIVLALLSSLPIRSWALLGTSMSVIVLCIVTARSRSGVALGVVAIVATRLLVGSIFAIFK